MPRGEQCTCLVGIRWSSSVACIGIRVHVWLAAFWSAGQHCSFGPSVKQGASGMCLSLASVGTLCIVQYNSVCVSLACIEIGLCFSLACIGINVHVSLSAFWAARQLVLVQVASTEDQLSGFHRDPLALRVPHSPMHMSHWHAAGLACALLLASACLCRRSGLQGSSVWLV